MHYVQCVAVGKTGKNLSDKRLNSRQWKHVAHKLVIIYFVLFSKESQIVTKVPVKVVPCKYKFLLGVVDFSVIGDTCVI